MQKKTVFIDTDCGIDDAVAIMMALAAPELEVAGISCVAGNTSLDNVVNNVCGLLSFSGRTDVPVFRGAAFPFVRNEIRSDNIHGASGLGNVKLDASAKSIDALNAVEGLLKTAEENRGMTLVTLGPLTNIAIALNLYPQLKDLLGEIVMMGGAVGPGNVTPHAEFNFAYDPEAIAFCLSAGLPVSILTWDAVMDMIYTEEEFDALDMGGSAAGQLFLDLQSFYMDYKESVYGKRLISFPDPLAMACVIDPSSVTESEKMNLGIILDQSDVRRGASVKDEKFGGHADVITKCDIDKFSALLKRIKYIGQKG